MQCRLAGAGFVAAENVTDAQCHPDPTVARPYQWNRRLLPYVCPLLARKFNVETVDAVMRTLTQV